MISIQPFRPSTASYEELVSLWNALHPEWPRSPAIWKRIDETTPDGGLRLCAVSEDRLVGAADVRPADNGSFDISLVTRPSDGAHGALQRLYEAMCDGLRANGHVVLRAYVADTRPWLIDFLTARGFRCVQKTAYSRLDALSFALAPDVERRAARVLDEGFEVSSLADLAARDETWKRKYWQLTCALLEEVPFEGGFRRPAFDAFERDLANPDQYNLAASYVVLSGTDYVGASRVRTWKELPAFAFSDLTGTLRSHRRRGLATLAKLSTIAYARRHGHRHVVTLNDVENPMLRLNHALGFKTQHIQHTLRAEL